MSRKGLVLVGFSMLVALCLSGCGGSPTASVAVTATATTVDATDTVTLTATVTNDKNSSGVTWSVSGGGTLSNTTTTTATYKAPDTAPSSPLTVTVTATSIADTTKTGTATLTVPAILTITTTNAQLTGAVGTAFSVQLTTSAAISPYHWTVDSSTPLPTNWNLSSTGLLTGPAPTSGFTGGTYLFHVSDSGAPTPMTASKSLTVSIAQAAAVTFNTAPTATGTYNAAYASAVSASGGVGALTYSLISGSLPAGLNLTSAGAITGTPTAAGTFNFTVQAADAYGDSNTHAYTITIAQATPTLTFAAIPTHAYGDTPFTVSASSASTGAVTYSVTSGPATIVGNTVTITGVGTVVLGASQAANTNYASATASTSFTVTQGTPTLTFTTIPTKSFGDPPFTVSASSASTGAITYSVTSGPATISGNTVTLTGAGTVVLGASQAATTNYLAATTSTSFTVSPTAPTLTFTTIPTHAYGDAPFAVNASSASTGAITYSVTSGPATISGNTVTLTGVGTVMLGASQAATANYGAATTSTSFTVTQGTPTLTFTTIPTHAYGDSPFTVSASSASTGAVTYSVTSGPATINGSTVTLTGVGTVMLGASQAATTNYTSATTSTSFTVTQGTPTLTFTSIPTKMYGDAAFTVSASSASTGAVTYSVTSGPAAISGSTVTLTGAGTVVLGASQAATTNYASTTASTSFTVNPATPTLTFTSIPTHAYGDAPFTVSASSASTGAVTYSVTSGPATISGSTVTLTGVGTVVLGASQAATTNYTSATTSTNFTVTQGTPTLTFTSIPTKMYGVTPFTVSASSASTGAITYSVTSGPATISGSTVTLTGAGTVVLGASQAATTNYIAATTSTSFTVNPATPTLTFTSIPTKTYGDLPFTVSASSASTGAITYSVTSGPATIFGSTVTLTGVGTVVLGASQAATTNYTSSTSSTSFTVNKATPTLTFTSIPTKMYGDAAFTVSASSASTGAITYTVTSGPATISGNTVTLTGAGTVVLGASQAATANYLAATTNTSFTVNAALSITTQSPMPTGVVGTAYSQQIQATGGVGSYTWSLISGGTALSNLGLTFYTATNTLAGSIPIAGGPASFTVQVSDSSSHSVQATFTVTINASLAITTTALSPSYVYTGSTYPSQTITVVGGTAPYTWSISSGSAALAAAGLSLSSGTGLTNTISGTVPSGAATGPINFTVRVVDANSTPATQSYTLTVYGALSTTTPSSTVPGPAVTGSSYTGANIFATGGSGVYSWSITGLTSGLTYNATGNPLVISGTAPSTSQTISANVTLTDTTTTRTYGPITYSIVVAPATPLTLPAANPSSLPSGTVNQSYNGAINASGGSGSGYVWSINGAQVPTDGTTPLALTDGLSAYNSGGNTLNISGTLGSTAQTITLTNVTVKDSANDNAGPVTYTIAAVNPNAGYTVSGTVNYSGSLTGWVYVELVNTNCTNCDGNVGTAINGPGAYTIHGVPAGTYTVQAWMDNTRTDSVSGEVMGSYGARNAANPVGVGSSTITVSNGAVTGANITLTAPTSMSLGTTTPTWDPNNGFGVFSGGAVVSYDPIVNSSGIEIPNSYIVQWSLNSSFSSVAGSQCFPATGAQQPWIVSGISGTGPYYFRAAGVLGSCVSGTVGTYSAATSSAYTITNPSSGYLIQGAVTWAGTATGPLYVGFYDMSTGKIYATVAGSKASPPTSPTSYSVYVPAGNNYFNFGIVDQNNNGLMVPGSIGNTNEQANTVIAISSATNLGTLALPTNTAGTAPLNSMAVVRTQSTKQTNSTGSTNYWYGVNLRVNGLYKLPESVQLFSGPSYLTVTPPVDISTGAFTGNTDEWDYYPSTNGATPSTNDVFTFNVGYTDGTSNSTANTTPNPITVSPTAVISAWATNMLPAYNTSSVSTTPTFAWNYPSSPSSYTYKFQLQDSSYKTIWSIPADNSHSNGFSSTVTPSITWGTDPTGGSSTPSVSSLDSNSTYTWSITAYDSNSNQATTQMAFTTPEASLTLPSSATGTALVNSPFSETLNASGGTGSGYVFTVAVNSGSAQTVTSSALLLTDGIYVSSNGSSLTFSGTPTTVETITLAVSVTDSSTNSAGPVTYYINVVNGPDGTHNGKLNGRYVCKTDGYIDSDGARLSSLSSIVANGSGILSDGVFNANSRDLYSTTGAKYGTMTGSYSIGSDNNGILTTAGVITSTGGGTSTRTWAIALTNATSPASQFRMVETDDVGASASGQHGTANCYLATTSAFDVSTFSGNGFAFGMQGENGNGIPKAYVGRMTASTGNSTTGGTISSGIMDGMRVDQTADKGGTFATTSTYSAPDAYGRVTLTIIPTGQTTGQTFVVYIIDADRMFLLQTAGDSGLMAGEMRTQQTSSFTWTNTVGNSSVLYGQGYEYSSGSVSGYDSSIMQASGASTGTYTGTLTVNASYDDSNGTYTAGKENGYPVAITLDSSNPGRATFSPGSDSAFLYFFKNGNAFFLDLSSGYLETGWLEAQSTTITTGAYMMSRLAPIEASGNGNVGEMTVTSGGSITGASSSAGEGNFSWDQSFSTTYTTDSATYGTFLVGSGSDESSCAVISSTKIVCLDNTSDHADMTILQK